MTHPQSDGHDDGLRPRCSVCNKPLSPGDFCDDLQCPNPAWNAAEGASLADEIKAADTLLPEASFDNAPDMLRWLNDDTAPPKPAPDAMRSEIARAIAENLVAWTDMDGMPIISGINSATSAILAIYAAPVSPADGARKIVCYAEGDRCLECPHYHSNAAHCTYKPLASSPSPAVAAEPCNAQMIEYARRLNDIATDCEIATGLSAADWRGHASDLYRIAEQIGRVAAPPVRGDRETEAAGAIIDVMMGDAILSGLRAEFATTDASRKDDGNAPTR